MLYHTTLTPTHSHNCTALMEQSILESCISMTIIVVNYATRPLYLRNKLIKV